MCGFYGLFTGKPLTREELKDQRKYSRLIKYRGPDFSGEYISNDWYMPLYPIYTYLLSSHLGIKIADIFISSLSSFLFGFHYLTTY